MQTPNIQMTSQFLFVRFYLYFRLDGLQIRQYNIRDTRTFILYNIHHAATIECNDGFFFGGHALVVALLQSSLSFSTDSTETTAGNLKMYACIPIP